MPDENLELAGPDLIRRWVDAWNRADREGGKIVRQQWCSDHRKALEAIGMSE
jgi:hypothetical protein